MRRSSAGCYQETASPSALPASPLARSASMRLHGFRQKRALKAVGLREVEMQYLKFAAEGDVDMVKRLFEKNSTEMLNRNCTDYFDRTALTYAVTNKKENMIQYLLNMGVALTESLFYAIDSEFTEAVECILTSPQGQNEKDMLITSEESIFPRFMSPLMLAAHKNNYEILEILYSHGHVLFDHSVNAANKWDEMRLKWLYYKARASQAYMILMWNKERVDPLNEAIDFYGQLRKEGVRSREVRENLKLLANQCEDFAISILDQLRTAQELADLLRFSLVGREHGNASQLVLSSAATLEGVQGIYRSDSLRRDDTSEIAIENVNERLEVPSGSSSKKTDGTLGRRNDYSTLPRKSTVDQNVAAEYIRTATDATTQMDTLKRIATPGEALSARQQAHTLQRSGNETFPSSRKRNLGFRRGHSLNVSVEYARPIHFLKPIEKAVDNGMIRLVTCENSQLALSYLKDGLLFRDNTPSMQLAKKFFIGFLFPLISMAFYVMPNSRIGRIARNPTAKLWMEVASDIYLIGLLVLNLILSELKVIAPDDFSRVLIVAYFWMPGKFINLVFLAYHQRKRVLYSIWNWNDLFTILLYTGFMILRLTNDKNMFQWSPIPLSDMMISVVYILVFLRPLEILRVNRTFGPLQVSVDRMMGDVSKFFLLFAVIWLAFSSGANTLFWRYDYEHKNGTCPNGGTCCFEKEDDAKFTHFFRSAQVHFWSIFGYSDNYSDWFNLQCNQRTATAIVGEIMFALYHIGTVLVLVNMLIAIMSGTLQKTIDESDIQWQFHRTRVWIRFIRTGFYRPPPMNLVPRPKEFIFLGKMIMKKFSKFCGRTRRDDEECGGNVKLEQIEGKHNVRNGKEKARDVSFSTRISRMSSYSSNGSTLEEEFSSRYDETLSKCVKRYLKARVVQGDDTGDTLAVFKRM